MGALADVLCVLKHSNRVDWKAILAEAQDRFGIAEFRPGQRELIEFTLKGQNALGILPTGAGKLLCYQPASFLDEVVVDSRKGSPPGGTNS